MDEVVVLDTLLLDDGRRAALVEMSGGFDIASVGLLRRCTGGLPRPGDSGVVVDLSRVEFVDVSALTVLRGLATACRRAGVPVVHVGAPDAVNRLAAVLGLADDVPAARDLEQARSVVQGCLSGSCD